MDDIQVSHKSVPYEGHVDNVVHKSPSQQQKDENFNKIGNFQNTSFNEVFCSPKSNEPTSFIDEDKNERFDSDFSSYSDIIQKQANSNHLKSILKSDNTAITGPNPNEKFDTMTDKHQTTKEITFQEPSIHRDNNFSDQVIKNKGLYRSEPQQNEKASKLVSLRKKNQEEYIPPIPEIIVHDEEGFKVKSESFVKFDLPAKKGDRQHPLSEKKSCCETIEYNDLYIRKYWDGRLKVLQFIATLGISICLPLGSHLYYPRFIYFRAAGIAACLFVMNDLFLHLFSLWELLPRFFRYRTLHMILASIAAICMLVGSSLIINVAGEIDNESMTLLSAFFGFVSMLLFGMETCLHLMRQRSELPYTSKPGM